MPNSYERISVVLTKPMGIVFSERGRNRGLFISDLPRTGEAARSGVLQKGDVLTYVDDQKMSKLDFDQAMSILASTTSGTVNLQFKRKIESDANASKTASPRKTNHSSSKKARERASKHGSKSPSKRSRSRGRKPSRGRSPSITQQMLENLDILCGGSGQRFGLGSGAGPCGGWREVRDSSQDSGVYSTGSDLGHSRGSGHSTLLSQNGSDVSSFYSSDADESLKEEDLATIMSEGSARDEHAQTPMARMNMGKDLHSVNAPAPPPHLPPPQHIGQVNYAHGHGLPVETAMGTNVPGSGSLGNFANNGATVNYQNEQGVTAKPLPPTSTPPEQPKLTTLASLPHPTNLAVNTNPSAMQPPFGMGVTAIYDQSPQRSQVKSMVSQENASSVHAASVHTVSVHAASVHAPSVHAASVHDASVHAPSVHAPSVLHSSPPKDSPLNRVGSPIPLALVARSESNVDTKQQVIDILIKHDPSRLPLVNKLLKKFDGREQELLDRLNKRYIKGKVDPAPPNDPATKTKVIASTILMEDASNPQQVVSSHQLKHKRSPSELAAQKAQSFLMKPQTARRILNDGMTKLQEIDTSRPETPTIPITPKSSPSSAIKPNNESLEDDKGDGEEKGEGTPEREGLLLVEKGGKAGKKAKAEKKKVDKERKRMEKKEKAVHAKVSKLVSFVYGTVSDSEHKARIKTILRAYKDREFVLLKLLETKAEVKIDNEKNSTPPKGIPKTISYVSDADDNDETTSIGSDTMKSGKSGKSEKSGKSIKSSKRSKSSRSRSASADQEGKSSSGRRKPPGPKKGITKSSNGEEDTISTLSHGTAKFARRKSAEARNLAKAGSNESKEDRGSLKGNSSGSSTKENAKERDKLKKRSGSWLFGKKKEKTGGKSSSTPKREKSPATPNLRSPSRGQSVRSNDAKGRILSQKSPTGNDTGGTTSGVKSGESRRDMKEEEGKSSDFLINLDRTLTSEI